MKRKLKKPVVYLLYTMSFIFIMGAIYLIDLSAVDNNLDEEIDYVNEIILDDTYPVSIIKEIILRPFLDDTVTVKRGFYSSKSSEEEQKAALIYYEGTYIPNSGVDYQGSETFDVVSILDGKVTKISENTLLGKIVEVTHSNNLISVYQSLSEVLVSEGDEIVQGQLLGKSGESNISKDLGNHLHFELIYNGENINPELCYGKEIDAI